MPRLPYLVIADDLTGAAEIAALAHQAGLRAVVLTEAPSANLRADVIVCDSDTRLDAPAVAARKVGRLAKRLRSIPHRGIFKKVDSVLRGNVVAELEACLGALGLERALLVPCNPSLGRIINEGRYYIAGRPLHKTAFRRDPHHPCRTSVVAKLIPGTVGCIDLLDTMPEHGIIVGGAGSPADMAIWASRIDDSMLPAGGADLFRMWLAQHRVGRRRAASAPPSARRTLLLSGTASPNGPVSPLPGPTVPLHPAALPSAAALAGTVAKLLQAEQQVSVFIDPTTKVPAGSAKSLHRVFGQLVRRLGRSRGFDHALVTGGTTASQVLAAMAWRRLEVVHVWGPGVVTVRPTNAAGVLVTMKPGSYPWPVSLRRHFSPTQS